MIQDRIKYETLTFPVDVAKTFAKNKHPFFSSGFRSGLVEIRREPWGRLTVCVTDGARLAVARDKGSIGDCQGWQIVLSLTDAQELLAKAKLAENRTLNIEVDGHRGEIRTGDDRIYRGLPDRFPNFEKVLPETFESKIWLDSNFTKTLRRLAKDLPVFKDKKRFNGKKFTEKECSIYLSHEGGTIDIARGRIGTWEGSDRGFYADPTLVESQLGSVKGAVTDEYDPHQEEEPILLELPYILDGIRHLGNEFVFCSQGARKTTSWQNEDQTRTYLLMPRAAYIPEPEEKGKKRK